MATTTSSSPVDNGTSLWHLSNRIAETPFPAGLASALLLTTLPKSLKSSVYRPAKGSALGFGAAFAAGGWIIYDGDTTNGAGFTSAWSILYLMVNGRRSIRQLRPIPIAITGLVSFNALVYGKRFFFPPSATEELLEN